MCDADGMHLWHFNWNVRFCSVQFGFPIAADFYSTDCPRCANIRFRIGNLPYFRCIISDDMVNDVPEVC
jgi:hypothetical protein